MGWKGVGVLTSSLIVALSVRFQNFQSARLSLFHRGIKAQGVISRSAATCAPAPSGRTCRDVCVWSSRLRLRSYAAVGWEPAQTALAGLDSITVDHSDASVD